MTQVLISIGKLAAVADIKTRGDARDRKQRLVGECEIPLLWTRLAIKRVDLDEELDVINVQDGLRKRLAASVPTRRHAKPSMETYASQYAQGLKGRPTFLRLFVETAQQLVDGSALDIEDLVDVLTMKDNDGENGLDPVIALERLVRDAVRYRFFFLLPWLLPCPFLVFSSSFACPFFPSLAPLSAMCMANLSDTT